MKPFRRPKGDAKSKAGPQRSERERESDRVAREAKRTRAGDAPRPASSAGAEWKKPWEVAAEERAKREAGQRKKASAPGAKGAEAESGRARAEESRGAKAKSGSAAAGAGPSPGRRTGEAGLGGKLSRHLSSARRATRRGLSATAGRARREWPKVRRWFRRPASVLGTVLKPVAVLALRVISKLERLFRSIVRGLTAVITWLARIVTPERAVFVVVLFAAGFLIASQYVDGRGVQVGQPQYAGLAGIAEPPQVDVQKAGELHSYLLVPVAIAAIVFAAAALVTRRRLFGLLVTVAGLAGVATSLLIDMPKGLDEGLAGVRFAGAHALLEKGFFVQLAASAVLAMCGLMLSLELSGRRQPSNRRSLFRSRRGTSRARKTPSLARSGS
jgi:hypothetical protein